MCNLWACDALKHSSDDLPASHYKCAIDLELCRKIGLAFRVGLFSGAIEVASYQVPTLHTCLYPLMRI